MGCGIVPRLGSSTMFGAPAIGNRDLPIRVPRDDLRAGACHRQTRLETADDVHANAVFAAAIDAGWNCASCESGAQKSGALTSSPRNPAGITPTISNGVPLTSTSADHVGIAIEAAVPALVAQHEHRIAADSSSAGARARPSPG